MMNRFSAAVAALLSALSLLSCSSEANHVYVSLKGDDNAAGTLHRPLRTPEAAAAKAAAYLSANPGSEFTITLRGGEYCLSDSLSFCNLPGKLTLEGRKGEDAILVGDRDVRGWTLTDEAGVWTADLRGAGIGDLGEPAGRTNRIDFYCGGKRQQIARWPDQGFTKGGLAIGKIEKEETWIHVHGTMDGIFEYLDSRIARWAEEDDPHLFGYWYWDWSDQIQRPAKIDTLAKVITMEQPYHHYGYRDSLRFYGMNLRCELDCEKEYYVDRKAGTIAWYAPEGFDPEKDRTTVSYFNRREMIEIEDLEGFTLRNLGFRGTRGGVISIKGGTDNLLEHCRMSQIGDVVVKIEGGRGHRIDHCRMDELCCGGIRANGGDRKTLTSSGFVVSNTVVENFSLFKRTYEPAIGFSGVGLLVTHNRFQGSSSSALNLAGNDITVEYNQCWDLVRESDDQGGVDMFFDYSYRRINFRYNHWKDIRGGLYAGAAGIRFDDIISGNEVYGDLFECCGDGKFGGIQINGGKDNKISNCVFYDCPRAVSIDAWNRATWDSKLASNMPRLEAVGCFGELYRSRYPELNDPVNDNLSRNYFTDNLVIGANELFRDGQAGNTECRYMVESGTTMVNSDIREFSFYLQPEVLKSYGLKEIPFSEIGPR